MTTSINPIDPMRFTRYPLNNITPFTYRDGRTFLEALEGLRDYITNTVVPGIDANFDIIVQNYLDALDQMQSKYDEFTATADGKYAELDALHDQYMADVSASLRAMNEPEVAALINDDASTVSVALKGKYVRKNELVVNVDDFGAVGDDVTDDSQAIRNALLAGQGRVVALTKGKRYYCGDARNIHLLDGTTLDGRGATVRFDHIDRTTVAYRFRAEGSISTTPWSFAASAASGDTSFTLTAATVEVGDTLHLHSNKPNEGGASIYLQGEIVTVRAVSGSTVTINEKLNYGYTTAAGAYALKVIPRRGVVVRNLRIEDAGISPLAAGNENGQRGVALLYTVGCRVENCEFVKTDSAAVYCRDSSDFTISGNICRVTKTPSYTDQKIYVIWVAVAARNGLITDNMIVNGSSGVAFSDSGAGHGNSLFVTVSNNRFSGCHRGVSTHSNSNHITIVGNTFEGCSHGINFRVRHGVIQGNLFANNLSDTIGSRAVYLAQAAGNLSITGNTFTNVWAALDTEPNDVSPTHPYEDVSFTGNTIFGARKGVSILGPTTIQLRRFVVSGNVFTNVAGDVIDIRAQLADSIITGNACGDSPNGLRNGIYAVGLMKSIISNNQFGVDTVPLRTESIDGYTSGNNLVSGNLWSANAGMIAALTDQLASNVNHAYPNLNRGAFEYREVYSVSAGQIPMNGGVGTVLVTVPGINATDVVAGVRHAKLTQEFQMSMTAMVVGEDTVLVTIFNHSASTRSLPSGTLYLSLYRR